MPRPLATLLSSTSRAVARGGADLRKKDANVNTSVKGKQEAGKRTVLTRQTPAKQKATAANGRIRVVTLTPAKKRDGKKVAKSTSKTSKLNTMDADPASDRDEEDEHSNGNEEPLDEASSNPMDDSGSGGDDNDNGPGLLQTTANNGELDIPWDVGIAMGPALCMEKIKQRFRRKARGKLPCVSSV